MNLGLSPRMLRRRCVATATIVVVFSACVFFSALGPAGSQPAADVIPWIDVHVHLLSRTGAENDFAGAAQAALVAMDSGLVQSVVMPMPQVTGGRRLFDWHDFVDALKKYPGRFAFLGGGGTLNPIIIDNAQRATIDERTRAEFARTAEEIIAAGAAGFGEMTAHHLSAMSGHPYESVPANHPLFLLLADIAARHDAVIDLHLDLVVNAMRPPPQFQSPLNPPTLAPNLAEFERLLAHNRAAKIVWAHAGSDPLGTMTPSLCRALLAKHPNLFLSLRMPARMPGARPSMAGQPDVRPEGQMAGGGLRAPGGGRGPGGPLRPGGPMGQGRPMFDQPSAHRAFTPEGEPNPEWLTLVKEFPDRFVIGGDQFIPSPGLSGSGAGLRFAQFAPVIRQRAQQFLAALPTDIARQVGTENARRLYKLPATP